MNIPPATLLRGAVFALSLVACAAPAAAPGDATGGPDRANTLHLPEGEVAGIALLPHAELLSDPEGQLTFAEVRDGKRSWSPAPARLHFPFLTGALWLRARLRNDSSTHRQLLLLAAGGMTERLTAFASPSAVLASGSATIGSARPFPVRPVRHRALVLGVELPGDSEATVWLRVESDLRADLPLELFSREAFYEHAQREHWVWGGYFGIFFIAIASHLFLFLGLRDHNYLIYAGYVAAMGLFMVAQSGYGFQYLWPESVAWNRVANTFAAGLLLSLTCVLTTEFLELRKRSPRVAALLFGLGWVAVVLGAAVFFLPLRHIRVAMNGLTVCAAVLVFVVSVRSMVRGYRPAIFFLAAFGTLLVGGLVYMLSGEGLFAVGHWRFHVMQVSSVLEVAVLSLGLGNRFYRIRSRNEQLEHEGMLRSLAMERIEAELDIARRIQLSILPIGMPRLAGLRVAARYRPMEAVGGDFYDFYEFGEDRFGVIVADVSGHGVPAALIASMLKVACGEEARSAEAPDDFLSGVNQTILGSHREFVTASLGFIDPGRRRLQYANAGHPPLVVLSADGACRSFRPFGRVLGIFDEPTIRTETVDIAPGDRLIFYTDGVIEARDPGGEVFGQERLERYLAEHTAEDPESLCDLLLKELNDWSDSTAPEDDVTLVIVELTGQ